ncbi:MULTISPECIES: hypothetical protein [Rhodomicrobium]|uniref:hypothetical protein n=1 Tax=Rhodomicrobium TaxID=1068 RepID=UPI000F74B66B|nr:MULTISPECIES: hypothetical protein [Rhodomicrobium]
MTGRDGIAIPYGVEQWPLERLADVRAKRLAGLPLAAARPGAMLRINGDALDLPPPVPSEANMPMTMRIAAHLKRLCGGWNVNAARFIDRYFAFLDHQIAHHRAELDARLKPFDGLFRAEDFIYSAPLPLPHALLAAPDFVKADFAFWLGDRMVAVLLAPSPLTPIAARRRKERLTAAGIALTECTAADLNDPNFAWFAATLGPEASRFWQGEALPAAPSASPLPDF